MITRMLLGAIGIAFVSAALAAPPPTEPSLKQIMQGLRDQLVAITDGLLTDDFDRVAQGATGIAEHPPIAAAQARLIASELGPEMQGFKHFDHTVHELSASIAAAARAGDRGRVVADYQRMLNGCVACHVAYKERVSAALDGPIGSVARGGEAGDFDWLSGHWCADSGSARIEELWLPPTGDMMLGVNRTVSGGRTIAFEWLRIVRDDSGARYVAQPGGRAPTSFLLGARGPSWVRFENPEHDFPQRIEYRRDGQALTAQISGPQDDGSTATIPFEFRACRGEPKAGSDRPSAAE